MHRRSPLRIRLTLMTCQPLKMIFLFLVNVRSSLTFHPVLREEEAYPQSDSSSNETCDNPKRIISLVDADAPLQIQLDSISDSYLQRIDFVVCEGENMTTVLCNGICIVPIPVASNECFQNETFFSFRRS